MLRKRQKPFSQLKDGGGQKKKILREVAKFLDHASGGDTTGLIAAYLESKFEKKNGLIFQIPRVLKLLQALQKAFKNQENFQKRQILSILRKAGFTMAELRNLGWNMSKKAWTSAGKHISPGR